MKSDYKQEIIIVDSSGLISLLIDSDTNYTRALHIINSLNYVVSKVLIPNDVFTETLNVLGKKLGHTTAYKGGEEINNSSIFQIIDTDDSTRQTALQKFKEQSSSVSFTDCIVMAIADMWETNKIFGFDEVFKKNGYTMP